MPEDENSDSSSNTEEEVSSVSLMNVSETSEEINPGTRDQNKEMEPKCVERSTDSALLTYDLSKEIHI